jgi:predicted ribonuclease YlaK
MKDIYSPSEILVKDQLIEQLYRDGTVNTGDRPNFKHINSSLILKSEINPQKTALVRVLNKNTIKNISIKNTFSMSGISPKDSRQSVFCEMLVNNTPISVAIGPAGTGKTTLAVAHALNSHLREKKKIYLCKSTALVSEENNAFGPVPGGIEEKYAPYISSFSIVLKKIMGEKSEDYLDLMFRRRRVQYIPVEFTRGCTYEHCTFILDEAQNLTWHELKSVVSRMGEGAQLIVLGDPQQIDKSFMLHESGLYTMLNSASFQESPSAGCIYLTKQYRGPIAQLISDIDEEIWKNKSTQHRKINK